MNMLFAGMCFIVLFFRINYITFSIDLFPDFIGYILIAVAVFKLSKKYSSFVNAKLFSCVTAGISIILFVMGFIEYKMDKWVEILIEVISVILEYYVLYIILQGVEEIEKTHDVSMDSRGLYKMFFMYIITYVLTLVFSFSESVAGLIVFVLCFASGFLFLVKFNKARRIYNTIE